MRNLRRFFTLITLLGACGDEGSPSRTVDGDAAISGADGGDATDERQHVTIQFKAQLGKADFDCADTFAGVGTSAVEVAPVDLRVFVQDVKLIRKRDGREVALELDERDGVQRKDVTLLDFEDNRGSCVGAGGTDETNTTVTGWVPKDEYEGIAFSNGVPEAVNHENPIDLTAPLVAGPLHWNWSGGFLFINAQLRQVDGVPDSANDLLEGGVQEGADSSVPGSAVVHLGSTLCSPNRGCGKSNRNRVLLSPFDHEKDRIVLDVAQVFADVDLRETTTCHAVGVECEVFFPAVGIAYETGEADSTQTIYRVE